MNWQQTLSAPPSTHIQNFRHLYSLYPGLITIILCLDDSACLLLADFQQSSQREPVKTGVRVCCFLFRIPQGLPISLRVKAKVLFVSYKISPDHTGLPARHSPASEPFTLVPFPWNAVPFTWNSPTRYLCGSLLHFPGLSQNPLAPAIHLLLFLSNDHHPTYCPFLWFSCTLPVIDYKLHEGREFCLFCSLPNSQHKYLEIETLKNIYRLEGWTRDLLLQEAAQAPQTSSVHNWNQHLPHRNPSSVFSEHPLQLLPPSPSSSQSLIHTVSPPKCFLFNFF